MGAEGELLHVLAADAPLLGDQLGAVELVDRCVAVPGAPALAARVRAVRQAEGLGGLTGGEGDRDLRHVLRAARDDEVLGAGQDTLGGEVHGLLGGAALSVDGDAGDLLGQSGRQPAGAGDVTGLRSDGVEAAEDHVLDGRRVDSGPLDEGLDDMGAEVGGVDGGRVLPCVEADRSAYRFDDVCLGHDFYSSVSSGVVRCRGRCRPEPSRGTGGRSPRGCAVRPAGTRTPRPRRCRGRSGR